jgi:hypothetical protein
MSFLRKNDKTKVADSPASPATGPAGSAPPVVRIRKGQTHQLANTGSGTGEFTLVTRWGDRDYDLLALVDYFDGHDETVSTYGTMDKPKGYSTSTRDGAVRHVTGDKAATGRRGKDMPYEIIHVRLNPNIRSIAVVVYSAKKSGVGSFNEYGVSTYVLPGLHDNPDAVRPEVAVEAVDASRNRHVYTFVPAVIHGGPTPTVEAVELYSEPGNENRPVLQRGRVTMNVGPENDNKK